MIKILIVIFSATGSTAKMAEVIQKELKQLGADIEEKDITSYDDRKDPLDLAPYHAVVFGFPIHARRAPLPLSIIIAPVIQNKVPMQYCGVNTGLPCRAAPGQ